MCFMMPGTTTFRPRCRCSLTISKRDSSFHLLEINNLIQKFYNEKFKDRASAARCPEIVLVVGNDFIGKKPVKINDQLGFEVSKLTLQMAP